MTNKRHPGQRNALLIADVIAGTAADLVKTVPANADGLEFIDGIADRLAEIHAGCAEKRGDKPSVDKVPIPGTENADGVSQFERVLCEEMRPHYAAMRNVLRFIARNCEAALLNAAMKAMREREIELVPAQLGEELLDEIMPQLEAAAALIDNAEEQQP